MKKSTEIETLLKSYIENIATQVECIRNGDARRGNKCARIYTDAGRQLINLGPKGLEALMSLLSYDSVDVRVLTACYLLSIATPDCLSVLRQEAGGNSLAAYGALQTLKRWERGEHTLNF